MDFYAVLVVEPGEIDGSIKQSSKGRGDKDPNISDQGKLPERFRERQRNEWLSFKDGIELFIDQFPVIRERAMSRNDITQVEILR